MIECRRINEWDVRAVCDFAIEGMQADKYPLVVSREKVEFWVRMFMREDQHYHQAAFVGSSVVGTIGVYVTELPFFDRFEGHVVLCRATEPGVGRRLIRFMTEWMRNNMLVRRVIFPLEEGADPRMAMLLRHFGFAREQTNLLYYKGA